MVKEIPKAEVYERNIITQDSDFARELYSKNLFGIIKNKKVELSFVEGYYLFCKEKIVVVDSKGKKINEDKLLKKFIRLESDFYVRYMVYKDMRDKGYIVKTGLKFGAEYRIYDKGIKPGEDHAKWILFPVRESDKLTWYDFAAKNRIAHSTKKRLLIGILDAENAVTYYEIKWERP